MNFDEYQNGGSELYKKLAKAVRDILEAAAEGRTDVPRVQAYQNREKGVESLKRKLTKRNKLDAPDIGTEIKDLAGARIILYTNIDYDRYLRSRLIVEALPVHWAETKAHYPNDENSGTRYEGFHYVACPRFRRHRVRCFYGTGGGSWNDGSLRGSSSLRLSG